MAKPWKHSVRSVAKFGGKPEDYIKIHEYMDQTKSAHATMKHRVIFHSAFGIYIVQDVFGYKITNSDGVDVPVRDIAEQHVIEDLGKIPSLDDWLDHMEMKPWMGGIFAGKVEIVRNVD